MYILNKEYHTEVVKKVGSGKEEKRLEMKEKLRKMEEKGAENIRKVVDKYENISNLQKAMLQKKQTMISVARQHSNMIRDRLRALKHL